VERNDNIASLVVCTAVVVIEEIRMVGLV
jgi:hypothetical protein